MLELIFHSSCLRSPHEVEVPRYILDNRTNLSWIGLNILDRVSDTLRAAQDAGKRGIAEVFEWSSINIFITKELAEDRRNEQRDGLRRLLENGQLVAVDYNHNCLLDMKHKGNQHIVKTKEYFENLCDWNRIVGENRER